MLLAPIYDELLSEVPKVNLHEYLHGLADLMEVVMPGMTLRMKADCSFGDTWGHQIEVGLRPTQETIDAALAKLAMTDVIAPTDDFDVSIFDDGEDEREDDDAVTTEDDDDD